MKSFLIVENDETMSKLNEELIKKKYDNALVSRASNGKEALEKTSRLDYTVILTDLEMPIMNGIEFHKSLKDQQPHLAKRVALVSAYADTPRASYFREEGCLHLTKPYSVKEFYNLIDSIVNTEIEVFEQDHGYKCMRQHVRVRLSGKCLLNLISSGVHTQGRIHAEIEDHSEGGMAIKYLGAMLTAGTLIKTFVEPLDIINKQAKVVWSKSFEGSFISGLQWV